MIAFAFGVFISYIFTPTPKVVIRYPTPQNAGKVTYVDDAGVCYRYKAVEVGCPKDKDNVRQMPLQQE